MIPITPLMHRHDNNNYMLHCDCGDVSFFSDHKNTQQKGKKERGKCWENDKNVFVVEAVYLFTIYGILLNTKS